MIMTAIEIKKILSKYFTDLVETLPDADAYAEIFCYRNISDPATIYYIPLTLSPEKGQQEKLQFNLIVTGSINMLQLASRWDINRDLLKKLHASVLEKLKTENISSINFSAPFTTVKEARLELADNHKTYSTLQSNPTSGFPPFNVIFNINLDNTQKDRVLHTLNGTDNYMRIRYFATIPVTKTASAALKGDLTKIPELSKPGLDLDNIPALLNKAIEEGVFVLEIGGDEEMVLAEKLKRLIFEKAIQAIKNYAENNKNYTSASNDIVMKEGNLLVKASAETSIEKSIEPEGDIANWFVGQKTTDYITGIAGQHESSDTASSNKSSVSAEPPPSKSGPDLMISAPPGLQESAINFITIISDRSKGVLSPPSFVPVKIRTPASGSLQLSTAYTDGGPPFETTIAAKTGNELILQPSDLGLSEVVFDAESLGSEEADSCRVHIVYSARGSGTDDDRTLYMKPGEWKSRWYVCSRDAGLNGELRYDVKVKNKDGTSSKYSGRTSEPVIHFETG
jgi:hypothetical protein